MASTGDNCPNDICAERGDANISAASPLVSAPQNNTLDRSYNQRLPIHRLPTEVLSMIFRRVTRVETCILDPCVTLSRTITLGAVCSYWRGITVNNSTFWTYIPIRSTVKSHKITSLCLERSRDSLIDVSAYLAGADHWHAEETLPLHTHRIRSLYISSRKIENIRLMMECMLSGGVPRSLKHTSIKILSPYRVGGISNSVLPQSLPELRETLHGLVKQLRTLRLKGVSLAHGSYSFDKIRDLLLDRAYPTDVVRILAPGNNVQSIEIRNLLSGGPDLSNDFPVDVASLKRLYLGGILDSATLCDVLRSIPPGPYEVDLTMDGRRALLAQPSNVSSDSISDAPRGVDILGPLLHKFNNITTLTLVSNMVTPSPAFCEKVHTLLRDLPNLYYLNLVRFRLSQPISAAMTRPTEKEPTGAVNNTFPVLRRLRLRDTRITDYEAFKAMVSSHQLVRLRISHCRLKWDGDIPTNRPSPSSPLFKWLSTAVPTVSIV